MKAPDTDGIFYSEWSGAGRLYYIVGHIGDDDAAARAALVEGRPNLPTAQIKRASIDLRDSFGSVAAYSMTIVLVPWEAA